MCLAVPGKVIDIIGNDPLLRSARVDFGGIIKNVSLACAPSARINDYVLVHVGLAIEVIDADEAKRTFEYLQQMGDIEGIEAPEAPPKA